MDSRLSGLNEQTELSPCVHKRAAPDDVPLSGELVRWTIARHRSDCPEGGQVFKSWCPCIPPATLSVGCLSCRTVLLVGTVEGTWCEHATELMEGR